MNDAYFPEYLQLEPTTRCNCSCVYCPRQAFSPSMLNKDLNFTNFKKIIAALPQIKVIHLQGMGEPLLNRYLKDILPYGTSKGIVFTTNTNALNINKSNLDLILTHFQTINISFDSVYKENFEFIRRGSSYEKVLENIKQIVAHKKKCGYQTVIACFLVLTHLNYKGLPAVIKLCEDLGVIIKIAEVGAVPELVSRSKRYSDIKIIFDKTKQIRAQARKIVEQYQGKSKVYYWWGEQKTKCWQPYQLIYITVDGFVTPCCMYFDSRVLNFGNIFKESFQDIWNSQRFKTFRTKLMTTVNNSYPLCRSCCMPSGVPLNSTL